VSRFIEIQHDEWVAATPEVVRAHYADLHHRVDAQVHPRERLRLLPPGAGGPRYERIAARLGRRRCDVFERRLQPDGSIVDTIVAGPDWGRAVSVRFLRASHGGRVGTLVEYTLTQPLSAVVGRLLARWIRRSLARELRESAAEDKADVERGYRIDRTLRAA